MVALPGRGGNHTLNLCMHTRGGGGTPFGSPFLYETEGVTNPPKRRLKHTFLFFIFVLVGCLYENHGGVLQAHIHYFCEPLLNCMKIMGEAS